MTNSTIFRVSALFPIPQPTVTAVAFFSAPAIISKDSEEINPSFVSGRGRYVASFMVGASIVTALSVVARVQRPTPERSADFVDIAAAPLYLMQPAIFRR